MARTYQITVGVETTDDPLYPDVVVSLDGEIYTHGSNVAACLREVALAIFGREQDFRRNPA